MEFVASTANNVAMDNDLPRIRDVDPISLLGAYIPGHPFQPYLPRAVDTALDEALAGPGLVLVIHESALESVGLYTRRWFACILICLLHVCEISRKTRFPQAQFTTT